MNWICRPAGACGSMPNHVGARRAVSAAGQPPRVAGNNHRGWTFELGRETRFRSGTVEETSTPATGRRDIKASVGGCPVRIRSRVAARLRLRFDAVRLRASVCEPPARRLRRLATRVRGDISDAAGPARNRTRRAGDRSRGNFDWRDTPPFSGQTHHSHEPRFRRHHRRVGGFLGRFMWRRLCRNTRSTDVTSSHDQKLHGQSVARNVWLTVTERRTWMN